MASERARFAGRSSVVPAAAPATADDSACAATEARVSMGDWGGASRSGGHAEKSEVEAEDDGGVAGGGRSAIAGAADVLPGLAARGFARREEAWYVEARRSEVGLWRGGALRDSAMRRMRLHEGRNSTAWETEGGVDGRTVVSINSGRKELRAMAGGCVVVLTRRRQKVERGHAENELAS